MAFPLLPFFFLFPLALVPLQRTAAVHPPLFNRIVPTSERTVNLTLTRDFGEAKAAASKNELKGNDESANNSNLTASPVEAKIHRLKELRNEMRALTAMIKEERRRSKSKDIRHRHRSIAEKMRTEISRQFRKWRKKVLSKIHLVMQRLDQLEGEMHRTKDNLQKVMHDNGREEGGKWGGGSKKRRPPPSHSAESLSAVRRVQMNRRGELGNVCQNHGECKPGHCCLRDAPMSTVPLPIGRGIGHCVRYALEEGVDCQHSCACAAQLLCFREHQQQQQKTNANSSSLMAVCKRASSSDLLNGVYENALDSVFEHTKRVLNANSF